MDSAIRYNTRTPRSARIFGVFLFFFIFSIPANAHSSLTIPDRIFSTDINYLFTGIENQGLGLGFKYEQKIVDHLATRCGFGHMTFKTDIQDIWCTSVGFTLFVNYYLASKNLDGPYVGMGGGYDFFGFFGDGLPSKNEGTVILTTMPIIGWKFYLFNFLCLDTFIGYDLITSDKNDYFGMTKYINPGFQYGVNLKVILR
jgi:hypothetical protein